MKNQKWTGMFLALSLGAVACGEDGQTNNIIDTQPYVQVEQLARPGINEALLISKDFLAGYNAAAPTFAGVPAETVDAVVGEAKTVLKALYLGVCLLDGAVGLTPATGFKPAGIQCHAVGPAIWTENSLAGVTLTQASKDAAEVYATKVVGQFLPDVMRIDTEVASGYLTLCGDATSTPLLCGGRNLNDDVIDITYWYLLGAVGAGIGFGQPYNQFTALASDGVAFSADNTQNSGNVLLPNAGNTNQFHAPVSNTFPYSAAPL